MRNDTRTIQESRVGRFSRAGVLAGLAVTLALAGATAPAAAGQGHGRVKVHGGKVVVYRAPAIVHRAPAAASHRRFVVPQRIFALDDRAYRPFYAGRVFHGPHRHAHVIYRFPVATAGGLVYRPYAYCDGRLVGLAAGFTIFGPHASLSFGWGGDFDGRYDAHGGHGTYGSYGRHDDDSD